METTNEFTCWVCGSTEIKKVKEANYDNSITSRDFAITDYQYGTTASIYRCESCGFLECPEVNNILECYLDVEDPEYESGRNERSIQANKLLQTILQSINNDASTPPLKLLDVGAGSGIFVEEAQELSFEAVGIEPSLWLSDVAAQRGLPVVQGVLPNRDVGEDFDIVTLIDVIEHVDNPRGLVKNACSKLRSDGVLVIVTPDVSSIMARILGWRWWHYRIAHVGYFSTNTITRLLESEGLVVEKVSRPNWYFQLEYLVERLNTYLPRWLQLGLPSWMAKRVIPLNLRDSIMVIARLQ